MFVRDFIHVARPFQSVAPRFLGDPRWLGPIVAEAVCEAARVSRALVGSPDCTKDADASVVSLPGVHLDRGAVRSRAWGLVVPISWEDAIEHTWFPPISGDLEIAPIGLSASELVLNASYRSTETLTLLGDDQIDGPEPEPSTAHPDLVHRVVETGVRAFLQNLAAELETEPTDGPGR
ncbi:MAG TPA: hypothetical protein VFW06_11025 [Acidimicrobiia bacterium]|nr:hypothetical protein [Acidimicrobiia bacterium]